MAENQTPSLAQKRCVPCEGKTRPMTEAESSEMLLNVPGWEIQEGRLTRTFSFKNYYQTLAFVNAAAWIAHQEDHHPDMEFGYKSCKVFYVTHAIGGLSENDFICAAKISALFQN